MSDSKATNDNKKDDTKPEDAKEHDIKDSKNKGSDAKDKKADNKKHEDNTEDKTDGKESSLTETATIKAKDLVGSVLDKAADVMESAAKKIKED